MLDAAGVTGRVNTKPNRRAAHGTIIINGVIHVMDVTTTTAIIIVVQPNVYDRYTLFRVITHRRYDT